MVYIAVKNHISPMADVAQLVRALVCGTRCREFESHHPPHKKIPLHEGFFYGMAMTDLDSREVSLKLLLVLLLQHLVVRASRKCQLS